MGGMGSHQELRDGVGRVGRSETQRFLLSLRGAKRRSNLFRFPRHEWAGQTRPKRPSCSAPFPPGGRRRSPRRISGEMLLVMTSMAEREPGRVNDKSGRGHRGVTAPHKRAPGWCRTLCLVLSHGPWFSGLRLVPSCWTPPTAAPGRPARRPAWARPEACARSGPPRTSPWRGRG